jgi:hypothetical protein
MNNIRRGQGFYQIERAYPLNERNDLRQHAAKMKAVSAELLKNRGGIVPPVGGGVAPPHTEAIQNNLQNKVFNPTRGGTAVQFLGNAQDPQNPNQRIATFSRQVQQTLSHEFGSTTLDEFRAQPDQTPATALIPIENLHVTALSMGVVDASSPAEFTQRILNQRIYRACFIYFENHPAINNISLRNGEIVGRDRLLERVAADPELMQQFPVLIRSELLQLIHTTNLPSPKLESFLESGGAVFNAVDLKVTNNGSVVIQMASNNDLVQIKEGLVPLGGIAKTSLGNLTASTIGFFPRFDQFTAVQRAALTVTINRLREEMIAQPLTARMHKLTYVNFRVNTLASEVIEKRPLDPHMQLDHMRFKYLQ